MKKRGNQEKMKPVVVSTSTSSQKPRSSHHATWPSSDSSDQDSVIDEIVTGTGTEASSELLSEETQLKIIEQTGIFEKLYSNNNNKNKNSKDSGTIKIKPLLEFSNQDLKSINKLKSKFSQKEDEGENEEQQEEEVEDKLQVDTLPLWVDRAFDTFLWSIPFNTIFICLDIAIHAQYGQPVNLWSELSRLKNFYPSSLFIIHYNIHYSEEILSKLILFLISTIGGSYMVYSMNKLSYLLVLKRVPSIGALWLFAVVRMNLSHCIFSLFLVLFWCWIMKLSLFV